MSRTNSKNERTSKIAKAKILRLESKVEKLEKARREREVETFENAFNCNLEKIPTLNKFFDKNEIDFFNLDEKYVLAFYLLSHLTNHCARSYKQVQNIIHKMDDKISTEFAYLARAEATVLISITTKTFDVNFNLALIDAITSARHIINDCLDIIAYSALERYKKLCSTYNTKDLNLYCSNFEQLPDIIREATILSEETRFVRGTQRIEEYINFIENTEKFPKLIDFCSNFEKIEQKLNSIILERIPIKELAEAELRITQKRHEEILEATRKNTKSIYDASKLNAFSVIFAGVLGALLTWFFMK